MDQADESCSMQIHDRLQWVAISQANDGFWSIASVAFASAVTAGTFPDVVHGSSDRRILYWTA
jgi:hypothetical protein